MSDVIWFSEVVVWRLSRYIPIGVAILVRLQCDPQFAETLEI